MRRPKRRRVVHRPEVNSQGEGSEVVFLLRNHSMIDLGENGVVEVPALVELVRGLAGEAADLSVAWTLHHHERIGDLVVARIGENAVVLARVLCEVIG